MAYRAAGRIDDAIKIHEATLKQREAKLGPDHPHTLIRRNNLVAAYQDAGHAAEAEPLLRDGLERARKQFGPADPRTAGAMASFGSNLIQQRKWAEAETILRECLAIRQKAQPDEWSTFNTRSMVGGSLLGQKKFADAEPLILAGYEGMKAREGKIPALGKPPSRKPPSEWCGCTRIGASPSRPPHGRPRWACPTCPPTSSPGRERAEAPP